MSGSASIFNTGGNYLFGNNTDGGQRLQVYGDAFIKGSGNTNSTSGLLVQNSAGTDAFRIYNDGNIQLKNWTSSFGTIFSGNSTTGFQVEQTIGITGNHIATNFFCAFSNTSGLSHHLNLAGSFNPSSGSGANTTITIARTINQTGSASGVSVGLYVNPTLTAAADWRSIQWSNNSGWGLYGAGTCRNYLNGDLWVGTLSATGYKLGVSGATLLNGLVVFGTYGTGVGMYWDNANNSFGIGNTSPTAKIDVLGINLVNVKVKSNTNSGATIYQAANDLNNTNEFGMWGSTRGAFGAINSGDGFLYSNVSLALTSGVDIKFGSGSGIPERMRLTAAGRLLLGTTTEGTEILKVQGNALVTGNITANGTITSFANGSDAGGIFYTNNFSVSTVTVFQLSCGVQGGAVNSSLAVINDFGGLPALTSATANYLRISSERNPGSGQITGTGTINFLNLTTAGIGTLTGSSSVTYNAINVNYTINRTGAGTMRGFYYNPTITSLAGSVHNAIQTTSGNVLFGSNFFWDNTNGSLGVGTNAIYAPSTFSLDVNGGLLVKNTSGRTAQITLINANPELGGNEGFIVHSVGGTSTSSFAQLQGYYGASIAGSTAIRLNPLGGAVIVNSTTNSGEQFQVTGDARITGTIYQDGAADALFNFQNAGANKWRIGNAFVSGSNYFQLYDSVSNLERIRWNNNSTATFTSDITFIGGSNAVATFQSTQPDVKIQASGASNAVSLSLVPSNGFEGVIQNNVTNGFIQVKTASTTRVTFKNGGQVNFQPLAADPAGAGAGDVYYNSGTNKLRLYDGTSWVDLN
jgi:hypothetical protein